MGTMKLSILIIAHKISKEIHYPNKEKKSWLTWNIIPINAHHLKMWQGTAMHNCENQSRCPHQQQLQLAVLYIIHLKQEKSQKIVP